MFCQRLGPSLKRTGIPMTRHNIHDNADDAALVRSVADGNETVPTIFVGSVAMVNPTVALVKNAVAEHAPHLLTDS